MARGRHPKKEIEAVLQYAESRGWRVEQTKRGHRWGVIRCPLQSREGCQRNVYSTPRVPQNHADDLSRFIGACSHAPPSP